MNDQPTSMATGTASGRFGTLRRSGPPWATIQAVPTPDSKPAAPTATSVAFAGRRMAAITPCGPSLGESYHFGTTRGKRAGLLCPQSPLARYWTGEPAGGALQRTAGTLGIHPRPVRRGLA